MSLFLVSQREDSFSLQLLLPQPAYPSPNSIYPSLQPPGHAARSINISQTKVQSRKNAHGLTEPKGISLPPTPTVLLLFWNPFFQSSTTRVPEQPPLQGKAGLGAGTERRTIQFTRLLKYLFSFHSLSVNNKTESQGAHRISEIIPFPVVLLQNTKLIYFPWRVLFGWAFLQAHKSKG